MSTPFYPQLPPPADPYGRTAKELAGYGGARPGQTGSALGPAIETVPVFTMPGFKYVLGPIAGATGDFGPDQRPWIDPKGHNAVRLIGDFVDAGPAGDYLYLMLTQDPSDDLSWQHPGVGGTQARLPVDGTGPVEGIAVMIDSAFLGTGMWCWKVFRAGGDGTGVGFVAIQFDVTLIVPERLYWRNLTPGNLPTPLPTITADGEAWGTTEPGPLPFDESAADIRDGARVLMNVKATSASSLASFHSTYAGAATHTDYAGPAGRLVGAPLAAQPIPPWVYTFGFTGQCPSATGAAMMQAELYIWRAATDTLELIAQKNTGLAGWYRYITKYRKVTIYGKAKTAQDGDRLVMDIAVKFDVAPGFLNQTNGTVSAINYDGANDLPDTDFLDYGFNPASYLDAPKLKYLNTDPTVAYP